MKNTMALLIILGLTGCAVSNTTYLPSGKEGHSINCSGSALHWGMCYEKAGELCGSAGYEVITKSGDQGATIAGNQYGVYGGTVTSRSMLIQCKDK